MTGFCNQAIENGIGLQDFFKTIEQKTSDSSSYKHASIFNKIAFGLEKGIAPSIKDIQLASNYFNKEAAVTKVTSNTTVPTINMDILRQMVEWDSKMKILTTGERAYLADLAYELKPLNDFHLKNAEKHFKTLQKSGFNLE